MPGAILPRSYYRVGTEHAAQNTKGGCGQQGPHISPNAVVLGSGGGARNGRANTPKGRGGGCEHQGYVRSNPPVLGSG